MTFYLFSFITHCFMFLHLKLMFLRLKLMFLHPKHTYHGGKHKLSRCKNTIFSRYHKINPVVFPSYMTNKWKIIRTFAQN